MIYNKEKNGGGVELSTTGPVPSDCEMVRTSGVLRRREVRGGGVGLGVPGVP